MNSDIPSKLLNERAGKVAQAVKSATPAGKIYIYEYPTKTLTVAEIERQLRRLQIESGVLPDLVIVDYLDILKPGYRSGDKYEDQGSIGEELRALAGKHRVPVVTASQVNRQGAGKQVIGGGDVSGSFEKIMVADEVLTISATDEELANGIARIHFANSRNSGSATFTIQTAFDRGRFYKDFLEDEV
jgi:replicative DNA helicase